MNKDLARPFISVIIPAYHCAPYLPAAIQSALDQTYPHIEVVVVNDGSPDDTDAAVAPYRDRIVYLKQENQGLSAARNAGFRASRGQFVCFLDADDTLLPDKFEKQLAVFQREPDLGVVISGFLDIAEDGETILQAVEKRWHRDALDHLLSHVVFPVHAALIRREVLHSRDPFPEVINRGEYQEDWQLWLDLALSGIQFSSVPEPTCRYWHRAGSGSSYPLRHLDGARRVVAWLRQEPRAHPHRARVERLAAIVEMERVARAWQANQPKLAAGALVEAVRQSPAYWREPFTYYRLFLGSLALAEAAAWNASPDPQQIEQRVIREILPAAQPLLSALQYNQMNAAACLLLSDLAYKANHSSTRRQMLGCALRSSWLLCLTPQALPSTLRGLLGPQIVKWLKRFSPKGSHES